MLTLNSLQEQTCSQLVLNWHVTEACNYSCGYCYAHWDGAPHQREILQNEALTDQLLQRLYAFFRPGNDANPLWRALRWRSVRLNFAGGEPLLYERKLVWAAAQARQLGFDVSLISNGSRLTQAVMGDLAPHLSLLGLSLDSPDANRNRAIGRIDRHGRLLNSEDLAAVVATGGRINPTMRLKINTVVNRLNCDDDMTDFIHRFEPDKWKVLRMLPVLTDSLAVSDAAFRAFVQRHSSLASIMRVEDNDDMTGSYLMIDPHGRFYQNVSGTTETGYRYSESILAQGAEAAFSRMQFLAGRFLSRYEPQSLKPQP